jgi:uncharacterized membrane protein YsdA (DUF1294 family)
MELSTTLLSQILAALCAWNLTAFIIMAIDKHNAVKKRRRIKEKALLICAFLFGGMGVMCGMYILRHKTRHWSFRILVPAAVISNIVVLYLIFQNVKILS